MNRRDPPDDEELERAIEVEMMREYLLYRFRIRPGYWFKAKRFGIGASPVTWQAWALLLTVSALILAIVRLSQARTLLYLVLLVPVIAGYLQIRRAKTDKEWRWRWREDD